MMDGTGSKDRTDMNSRPRVTVIIATFNYGRYLGRAIDSVLSRRDHQTSLELLVIDGTSTDNTQEVMSRYRQLPFTHFMQQPGKGLANAVNHGIRHAKGAYILRLDADDLCYPEIIEKECRILDTHQEVDFVYPDYHYCLANTGEKVRKFLPPFNPQELQERGDFLSGGALFRKSLFDRVGGYDESVPTLDSYELILRFMSQGVIGYHIPESLFEYTIHGQSLSDNLALIDAAGQQIASRYGRTYTKNRNHPRYIPGITESD